MALQNKVKKLSWIPLLGTLFGWMGFCIAEPSGLISLTPEQAAGKEIFELGEGETPIVAIISGVEVPATVMPCMNCHGETGKGIEGGAPVANISPAVLGKPLSIEGGRTREAYTDKKLKKAITMGLDASNNTLLGTMPKYQMSSKDMEHLLAYLKVLGQDPAE